ncbi:MAG TPA: ATP-binding protein [Anaerolineales bacterium]|jgi:hypothetical protein|nr:hypothetical protein [Anaerolineae bacterium]HRJ54967.1 ATP-binding protein [Anaerolineales bacterium]HRK89088.1 ATP-binding protein [Anaerolineales bacterium]
MTNNSPTQVITPEFLFTLLSKEEGPTLDFKRKPYLIYAEDKIVKDKQRGELIKDILALANGNSIVAGDTAYLVIGADDKKREDGTRTLFDVGNHRLTARNILDIVNSACEPALEDVFCDELEFESNRLLVITINPTPYLHETIRRLETSDSFFSERTVFVRHNEGTEVASAKERDTISQIKRFRFGERRNPPGVPFGVLLGGVVGGIMGYSTAKHRPDNNQNSNESYGIAGTIFGVTLGWTSASIYRNYYEIRSNWHRVPPKWRIPSVTGIIGISIILTRALSYILRRIAPKKKP